MNTLETSQTFMEPDIAEIPIVETPHTFTFTSKQQEKLLNNAIEEGLLPKTCIANPLFSLRVHKELEKQLPELKKHTIFYIGAGGDFISSWLAIGADEICLIDKTPFFIKSQGRDRDTNDVFNTFDEVWENAEKMSKTVNIGALTYHENVQPAVQICISFQQLGLKRENISYISDGNQITLIVDFEPLGIPHTVAIQYFQEEIRNSDQILDKLDKTRQFGLMTKGGTGELTTELFRDFPKEHLPSYLITDDLTGEQLKKLSEFNKTDIKNKGLFPVGWGWQLKSPKKDYFDIAHIFITQT